MERIFYRVSIEVMRELKWVPLANPPYLHYNLNIMFEDHFWFYLRKQKGLNEELKDYYLWSIPSDKQTTFEDACKALGIKAEKYDQQTYYKEFEHLNRIYIPTKQKEIPAKDMAIICSSTFPHIICGPGTTEILLEHYVGKEDKITLYINSNEMTGHNIPHCHVKYNDDNNYCVLSLVDFTKIAPNKDRKNAVICKAQNILQKNIQLARKKWNEVNSLLKFKTVDGQYTSEYGK